MVRQVLVREGHGLVRVNGEPYDAFFPELLHRASMLQPLLALPHLATHFNVEATVAGGGKSAQVRAWAACPWRSHGRAGARGLHFGGAQDVADMTAASHSGHKATG